MLLEDNYDAKHRAGVSCRSTALLDHTDAITSRHFLTGAFFIAFGFVFSLLFSATVENVYPCGNDLAALCPRYISVKRGFFICIAISIALNPWCVTFPLAFHRLLSFSDGFHPQVPFGFGGQVHHRALVLPNLPVLVS